jgi:hypothetical protein
LYQLRISAILIAELQSGEIEQEWGSTFSHTSVFHFFVQAYTSSQQRIRWPAVLDSLSEIICVFFAHLVL